MDIKQLFALQRIETTIGAIVIFLYLPLGSLLLLFRLFLTLNLLFSQLVFNALCLHSNAARRLLEKIILAVLGVFVVEKKSTLRDTKSIVVANNLCRCDHLVLPALCNYVSLDKSAPSNVLKDLLRFEKLPENKEETLKIIKVLHENKQSVICFPQHQPTNNIGLMKFIEWPFSLGVSVQPVAVQTTRLLPVSCSTIDSTWWQDLLWTYFSLCTVYNITYLPPIAMQSDEDVAAFGERVRKSIAGALDVPCTHFTSADVNECLKRMRFEARKPQQHLHGVLDHRTTQMAKQVKDILPHVPLAVIVTDIEKTQSIDVTVANILEGVVKYVPEQRKEPITSTSSPSTSKVKPSPSEGQKSFSRNPTHRHSSLQERKDAFIKEARDAYLRKHAAK